MTKQVQRRRGTATQHTSFTGAEGEISVNTTNKSTHVHDGATAGGIEAARADLVNVSDASLNAALTGNTVPSLTITTADINGGTIDGATIDGRDVGADGTTLDSLETTVLTAGGTGYSTTYVSTVAVGGTTFAQPAVSGTIHSDQGEYVIGYAGATGITVASGAASVYVYIDNASNLQQQTTIPTRQDWSRKMFTMRIAMDTSAGTILGFEYLANPLGHYPNSIRDFYSFMLAQGVPFKKDQVVTGRAGDLGFDVSAGEVMELGGTGDIHNANIISLDAVSNAGFFLTTRTAFDAGGNTNLPKFWDNGGTLTALGSTTLVGHRLYRFSNGNLCLQYGQGNYANMTLARAGVLQESYVLNPALKNATFFGWWFIESTATNTGGTTLTAFVEYTLGIQGGVSSALSGAALVGNNGSDFLDAAAVRTNIGLGTGDSPTFDSLDVTGTITSDGLTVEQLIDATLRLESTENKAVFTPNVDTYGTIEFYSNDVSAGGVGIKSAIRSYVANTAGGQSSLAFSTSDGSTNDIERMNIDSSGNVGIGTSSINARADVSSTSTSQTTLRVKNSGSNPSQVLIGFDGTSANYFDGNTQVFRNGAGSSEAMRIDSSRNVLIGKTSTAFGTAGHTFTASGIQNATRAGGYVAAFNRLSDDGDILQFYKDGSTVGSIGVDSNDNFYVGAAAAGHSGLYFGNSGALPMAAGARSDNSEDLGSNDYRFDDVYATNGTIQTSDRNEKQDIASLTPTEMLVAARLSTGFKNFKWKDKVASKGDDARLHSGAIAQDVQDAFTAEGLDAGNYAMFISGTWWEHNVDVPAVEVVEEVAGVQAVEPVDYAEAVEATYDEDGIELTAYVPEVQAVEAVVGVEYVEAVEAKDAYTRTDTYNTLEEAPDDATERTRLGIRYPELLSFVAAYNEQRFASIETRLKALEA